MNIKERYLVVHFQSGELEDAAFATSQEEAEIISCNFRKGDDSYDFVRIPIETAAAAPWLLEACRKIHKAIGEGDCIEISNVCAKYVIPAIAKASRE